MNGADDEFERPFVEAIENAPDDEGPRLIFADWLDDRRDPRGEMIRLDCILNRPDLHCQQRKELQQRLDVLFRSNNDELPPWIQRAVRVQTRLLPPVGSAIFASVGKSRSRIEYSVGRHEYVSIGSEVVVMRRLGFFTGLSDVVFQFPIGSAATAQTAELVLLVRGFTRSKPSDWMIRVDGREVYREGEHWEGTPLDTIPIVTPQVRVFDNALEVGDNRANQLNPS